MGTAKETVAYLTNTPATNKLNPPPQKKKKETKTSPKMH